MGINATVRLTGVRKTSILRLLERLGTACHKFHDDRVRGLTCSSIQCDEIWAFCYAKEKNVPEEKQGRFGYGDVWTWTAIDADTKLMVSWLVGQRDTNCAMQFMNDVADRIVNRVQLTTDGLKCYLVEVPYAFGSDIDFAQLVKVNGPHRSMPTRYSPPALTAIDQKVQNGNPDHRHVSNSYVERSNLTMRMQVRRFTRLTNGHPKKIANHEHMNALCFTYYNFGRKHMTLKKTPAMAAGLADHIWTVEEIILLADTFADV